MTIHPHTQRGERNARHEKIRHEKEWQEKPTDKNATHESHHQKEKDWRDKKENELLS